MQAPVPAAFAHSEAALSYVLMGRSAGSDLPMTPPFRVAPGKAPLKRLRAESESYCPVIEWFSLPEV